MDKFQVRAEDTTILESSHIVEELRQGARELDIFPVLIGTEIAYFHDVDGGFVSSENYHVVNLIHRVQGATSPANKLYDDTIEVHLSEHYYQLEVADITTMGDYPSTDFTLSLKVSDYMMGPYSFSEAMSSYVDKREQQMNHNSGDN